MAGYQMFPSLEKRGGGDLNNGKSPSIPLFQRWRKIIPKTK
jgi:hypothetical protein